jgi:DNA (cytosine-5)-methyltransferase 1
MKITDHKKTPKDWSMPAFRLPQSMISAVCSGQMVKRLKRLSAGKKPAADALREDTLPYCTNGNDSHGELTFIDLFCGIGGFRIAFEHAGCRCVFSSDWNEKAQDTYLTNFGERPYGDIYSVPDNAIPSHNILCAGFPCQPFSIAGVSKKNSLGRKHGFEDKVQGNLFFKLAELIEEFRPDAFLLENVKNLKSHDKGKTFRVIWETLTEKLKYHVYPQIVDAQSLVPQHRERIFLVGFREPRMFDFPKFPQEGPKLNSILEKNVPEKYTLTPHLWQYLQDYAAKHRAAGNGFGFGLVNGNQIARTLSARYYKDGSEILISQGPGTLPRRLTPRECARLMGYPDSFKIEVSDTQAYKQFGNSVVVPVVERIAKAIVATLRRPVDYRPQFVLTGNDKANAKAVKCSEGSVSYRQSRRKPKVHA